jgi:hypothetical protein
VTCALRRVIAGAACVAVLATVPLPAGDLGRAALAQAVRGCAFERWNVGGDWTTTETVHGANESFWRARLSLVQRGDVVAGRLEAPDGQPEQAVLGRFRNGVLQLEQLASAPQAEAAVQEAPARHWTLSLASDGRFLAGSWWEESRATARAAGSPGRRVQSGDLFAEGEATCAPAGERESGSPEDGGAAASRDAGSPSGATEQREGTPGVTGCGAWDLTGAWAVTEDGGDAAQPAAAATGAAGTGHRLRLWQQGERVIGWYERSREGAVAGGTEGAGGVVWAVDGVLRGRALRLTHHLGDGATLERQLELSPDGARLTGPFGVQLGPPRAETLVGQAACLDPAECQSPSPPSPTT